MSHVLYCDGASRGNPGAASFGFVLLDSEGNTVVEEGRTIGTATNNVAEYEGLVAGLEAALETGVDRLDVRLDSLLLVRQVEGDYRVKAPGLKSLHRRAVSLLGRFDEWTIHHVPRRDNARADALANAALDGEAG